MKTRSKKSPIPFVDGGRTFAAIAYVVVHAGQAVGQVEANSPFGESARRIASLLGLSGEFQVWLESHWNVASRGVRGYKPLLTVAV